MLEELHVRDLASIADVWLEFGPGLNVLTGETGAGKTALVGALQLLLGERAASDLVRSGAAEALVEGRLRTADGEVVVRRRVSAEGRSRCYLNGELATVGALGSALGPLVDLHGQHEHQALLTPSRHAAYLDRFARAGDALWAYRASLLAYREALAERDALAAAFEERDRREGWLRFQVAEIDAAAPSHGEDAELEERLPRLRHGERLAGAASSAYRRVRDDDGASDAAGEALSALSPVAGLDPSLDALAEELAAALASLDDVATRLREYGESVDHDPRALDEAEARLGELAALKKKYGPSLDDVLRTRDEAAACLEAFEAGESGLADAETRVAEAAATLRECAERLCCVRSAAVADFSARLGEAARDLAMPHAAFEVALADVPFEDWAEDGPQRVEFLFSATRGEPARPLARIASGGESSRVMLALKGVLGDADAVPVLVFDEVDAGIGGATASAVGRRLSELAATRQVLVVTHLAQVAAFADRHVVVAKEERDGREHTVVRSVDADERVAEVARMLSGGDSEASLAHARELMDQAVGRVADGAA